MSLDYQIAIKTYQRAPALQAKTLALFARHGISTERVTLFVASDAEKESYGRFLSGFRGDICVQKEAGIRGVVRTYRSHYAAGTQVLHCDDDLMDLMVAVNSKQLSPIKELDAYVRQMFDLTQSMKGGLWSIFAVHNPFFMRNAVMTGLKFCSGCFHGFISDGGTDARLITQVNYKDDVEASILYFLKHGLVVRDERVVAKTQYFKNGGGGTAGEGHEGRTALHLADVADLAARFPQYCHAVSKKNFGGTDIRLNPRIASCALRASLAQF